MNKSLLLLLVLVIACNAENVQVLTTESFDEVLKANQYVLVEFYAPWCGHCKSLAPEYEKAATALLDQDPKVVLANVDATEHKELASRFGVQGFPTLKWFVNGEASEYTGGRTESTIVSWIKKKVSPASAEKQTKEEVEAFKAEAKVTVAFFGTDATAEAFKTYLDVTKVFDDVVFAHTFNAALPAEYGVAQNTVVLFRTFEEPQLNYAGEFTVDAIKAWIDNNSLPTVMDFDQPAAQKIFGENLPALFVLTSGNDASTAAVTALNQASSELKGKILMSATQVADGLGKRLGDYIGVTDAQTPCVRIVNPTKEGAVNKYEFEGEITAESLVKFYSDFAAGTLQPVYKSEDVPETQDKAVFKLVGKQFKDVVMDSTKDVLVEYFAPWCGHCKSLAPIYEELAQKLKANTNIVIAAMDATANEAEGVNVEGFPTIKFYPANNKAGLDYKGGRTLEDMLKYLKDNATVQWVEEEETAAKTEDL